MERATSPEQPTKRSLSILSLFSYAHFAEHLSSALLVPLLPFIRNYFGLSYFEAGLLVTASSIASGLANLPMGWLGDRVGIRLIFALGIGGVALGSIATGLSSGFYQLLLFTVLVGLFSGAYHPVSAAFLSQFFGIKRRGRALGMHMVGGTIGVTVAPVLGGLLAAQFGWRYAFIFMALPSLPLVFFFLRLRYERPAEVSRPSSAASQTQAASQTPVASQTQAASQTPVAAQPASASNPSLAQLIRPIALVMLLSLLMQLISMGLTSLFPVYLVDRRLVTPAVAAMFLGLVRGGGVVGALLGGFITDRIGRKPSIMLAIMAVGPLLFLTVITPMGPGLVAALLLLGLANQLKQPAIQALLVEAAPSGRQGTLLGIYFFFAAEGRSLFVPLVGYLMDTIGLSQTFVSLSLVAVAFSLAALVLRKRV